eukprot:scaffold16153_cov58-Phaeocystis_antarctica.AAC.2
MARGAWQVAGGTRHAAWQVGARGCGGEARLAVGEVHEKLEDVGHRHRDDHVEDHVPRAQRAHHPHLARCGVHAWPVCVRVRLFGAPQSENVTTNLKVTPLAGYGMFPVNRSGSLLGSGPLLRLCSVRFATRRKLLPPTA